MKPIYYKSACSIFKGLKEGVDIFGVPGYLGIEVDSLSNAVFLKKARSKDELEKYWELSSEEEFNDYLINLTEHLKGL